MFPSTFGGETIMARSTRFARLMIWIVSVLALSIASVHHDALAKTPAPGASIAFVTLLDGKVENVGSGKDNGVLQMSGTARGDPLVDLSAATLSLTHVLHEIGGTGELVRDSREGVLPLYLTLGKSKGKPSGSTATFESGAQPGDGPKVKVTIVRSNTKSNEFDFTIQIDRAVIPAPRGCGVTGTAALRTRFVVADSAHRRVRLSTRQNWQCSGKQLKSPTPADRVSLGLGGTTSPEALVGEMAENLAVDIAANELQSVLFPESGIDYQTLMDDFELVVNQAIEENDIVTDEASINGFLNFLNDEQGLLAHGHTASEVLADMNGELEQIEVFVAHLQSDGLPGVAGWVAGAQTLLNTLQFLQQLTNSVTPTDLSYNVQLAQHLDEFLQYLVSQRATILHQNVIGSLHYCFKSTANGKATYNFKNCTGAIHENPGLNSCELSALPTETTSCVQPTLTDQTNELFWMDQVIGQWRSALAGMAASPNGQPLLDSTSLPCATCQDAYSAITVQSVGGMATVVHDGSGDSDKAPAFDTTPWVKAACDALQTCDYQLQSANFVQSPIQLRSVTATYTCGSDPTPHIASLADVGNPAPALYDGAYLHLDCAPRVANLQAAVQNQPVAVGDASPNVSTDSQRPDAGKITDGILAPPGQNGGDTTYAIILPHNGAFGALTIDLGATVNVCGNGFDCLSGPMIQADNDDHYELDYSTDGIHWVAYGQFQTVSSSGLRTRGMINCGQSNGPPCDAKGHGVNFSARYARVFAVSGGNTFSVSELQLWNTGSTLISVGKHAWGPEPLITNGQSALEGTSWNDSLYATVFPAAGPSGAVVFDLGEFHSAIEQVFIQADGDDSYQVDVSGDGGTWFNLYSVPPVSSESGLRSRKSPVLPPSAGRYVRIYPTHGVDFSVSEVQLFANQLIPTSCNGQRVCGISAATVLEDFPSAQAKDVSVNWTCGSNPTPYAAQAVPWVVSRSGISYPDVAVLQARCRPSPVTCTDPVLNTTTCSNFAKDASDDVVYGRAANIPYQLSASYPSCSGVIGGKVNFYHNNLSTQSDGACVNVQRSINDAVSEGSCPSGIGMSAGNSWMAWPYNVGLGTGSSATPVIDPALGQPPLLLFLGCNSLLQ